ncbi:hypothetical protein WJX81_000570 [Elliptochloris bilobata]|uniref:procollagen-proline 4-dioxygenase n=1 Tax=Elliptochloris bilobata TaxID=381761 RepID=A0AAW1R1E0_9CHLO
MPAFRTADRLIGWKEEPPREAPKGRRELWIELLSWTPRIFIYHNLLTDEECNHLVEKAKPHQVKSTVVDSDTGKSVPSNVRTSSGSWYLRRENREIADIEARIAKYTAIPVEHGEGLQILHYQHMEKYEAHWDYFVDSTGINTGNGGQRLATLLIYLSDVEEGGETVFPNSAAKPHEGNASFSTCAQRGVAFKPKKGDALLFYSLLPNGKLDPLSLHGGCPVIRGNKWSATKWMRVGPYAAAEGRAWRGL